MLLSGAEILIETLKLEGADTVFGYPGGAALPLYDALYGSSIRHILTRHEQGAAHAADGYARVSGKAGVCFSTSGPGATNLVTGIATANMDSSPLVCITCQVTWELLGKDSFQEADVIGITAPITKHNFIVKDIDELAKTIKKAFFIASTGRPGPVVVDVPKDILIKKTEFKAPEPFASLCGYEPKYKGKTTAVTAIAKALSAAKRPLLFLGGGVVIAGAQKEALALAQKINIPVICTLMGMTAFPTNHPQHLGMAGMHGSYAANMAITECDLLVGCGVRFDDRVTGSTADFASKARIAHLDIDPAEINKNVETHFKAVGDLSWSLPLLIENTHPGKIEPWWQQICLWQQEHPLSFDTKSKEIKPQEVLVELDKLVKGEAVLVTDVGQHQMWTAQYCTMTKPRHFITSGGLGTMGFGLPAAIGAQIACPKEEVWLITGDGSIMMNCQEMATAAELKLPIRVAILNNRGLGMVRQWQRFFYNTHYSSSRHEPDMDFANLAKAFGCTGIRVDEKKDLPAALAKARSIKGPVIIDIRVDNDEDVMPMVAPGQALAKMIE